MLLTLLLAARLMIGDAIVTVEIADTLFSQNRGLMGRTELPSDHGMLFVYDKPDILSFWMRNTLIPLSIGFFDEDKTLIKIDDMTPPLSKSCPLRLYKSPAPAQYALEVPKGWFKDHKIAPGMKFTLLDCEN